VRAIYQRYLGFYDGNPAHLNPHEPVAAGKRYVAAMGGADALLAVARQAFFADGDYRWVTELVNHLVFADPDNQAARELQADALEQLGYQCENGTWRSLYLTGARELRHGVFKGVQLTTASPDTIRAMSVGLYFDYLGIRIDADKAAKLPETILNWKFTDIGEDYAVTIRNAAPTYRRGVRDPGAAATITLTTAGSQPHRAATVPARNRRGAVRRSAVRFAPHGGTPALPHQPRPLTLYAGGTFSGVFCPGLTGARRTDHIQRTPGKTTRGSRARERTASPAPPCSPAPAISSKRERPDRERALPRPQARMNPSSRGSRAREAQSLV
jgi:Alkyl sulfatase dimerisation/Alkyl sulfatase C-terminal